MVDHFSPKVYANKPSGIVTYSVGLYGGARAAMQLRALTGELGCISVSPIVSVIQAQNEFDADGKPTNPKNWPTLAEPLLKQLEWTAQAFKNHRKVSPP